MGELMTAVDAPASDEHQPGRSQVAQAAAERFEAVYRATATAITAYFLRRTGDPQLSADLTADTFVEAMGSFSTYCASRGTPRPWVFGIARRVFARHCETQRRDQHAVQELSGHRTLDHDELEDLLDRIDAERPGMQLLQALASRPRSERELLELVALADLTPREAAEVLGISSAAARVRLFRARRALREHAHPVRSGQEVDAGRTSQGDKGRGEASHDTV